MQSAFSPILPHTSLSGGGSNNSVYGGPTSSLSGLHSFHSQHQQQQQQRPLSHTVGSSNDNMQLSPTITNLDDDEDAKDRKPKLTRIHQACVSCGTKKQKCSGETPCQPCKVAGIPCEYKEAKKRGPPKGTKRVRKAEVLDENGQPIPSQARQRTASTTKSQKSQEEPSSDQDERPTQSKSSKKKAANAKNGANTAGDAAGEPSVQQSNQFGNGVGTNNVSDNHNQDASAYQPSQLELAISALSQVSATDQLPPELKQLVLDYQQQQQQQVQQQQQQAVQQAAQQAATSTNTDSLYSAFAGSFSPTTSAPPTFSTSTNGTSSIFNYAALFDLAQRSSQAHPQAAPSISYNGNAESSAANDNTPGSVGTFETTPSPRLQGGGTSLGVPAQNDRNSSYNPSAPPRDDIATLKSPHGKSTKLPTSSAEGERGRDNTHHQHHRRRATMSSYYDDEDRLNAMNEIYRGATSGIPSLHARRTHSSERAAGGAENGGRGDTPSASSSTVLGKRDRGGDETNGYEGNSNKYPARSSSTVPGDSSSYRDSNNNGSSHQGSNGYGSTSVQSIYKRPDSQNRNRNDNGLLPSSSSRASSTTPAQRDVQAMVDHISQFTLPPIRLPTSSTSSSSHMNNASARDAYLVTSSSLGLHIPKGLFDRLISYYFAISHHSCPIIYKPDVDIADIQTQLPQLLLDGMCCLAARFLENEDFAQFFPLLRGVDSDRFKTAREQIEQHYYDRARRQIQEDDYRSDVTTVQALLLLAKRDNGGGRMLHCWQLVGSATRMVIDLGLHRKATIMGKSETTYGQIETRRRVFWQAYIMDKHAAASLGRPVFLREEDIDVLLPSEVAPDEFERWAGYYPFSQPNQPPPENRAISTHNAFARLSIILQSIINDVYSTRARKNHFDLSPRTGEYMCYVVLRELFGQLCAWKNALPAHLQWAPDMDQAPPLPHQLLLHAFFNTCLLLVFRPLVPVSTQVSFPNSHQIPRPHDVCTRAADTIMTIMDVYEQSYGLQRVPSSTAVYYIFTAATIYVGNSSSANPKIADEANANLDKCIRLLDHLSDACCAASQHRQILLDITSLGSTKLKSRDDADNLLSSRVPKITSPNAQSESPARSPKQGMSEQPHPIKRPPHHQQQKQQQQQQQQQQAQAQQQSVQQPQSAAIPNVISQSQLASTQSPATPVSALSTWSDNTARNATQPMQISTSALFGNPQQNHQRSTAEALFPSDPQYDPVPSFFSHTYPNNNNTLSGFDSTLSTGLNNTSSNPLMASQADLAFWREMPIGCADPGDWNIFTDSYAQQLMTAIPQLGGYNGSSDMS